jgi:hypothetical protein
MSENGTECLNEEREMDIQDAHTSWPSTFNTDVMTTQVEEVL